MSEATHRSDVGRARIVRAWLWVAAWATLVWTLSSDEFAAPATEGLLGRWLRAIFPDISADAVALANFAVRKSAHATEYAVLGLLAFRATRLGDAGGADRARRQAVVALAVTLAVALADETRQSFSAARGGSPWDVVLDLAGATAAVALAVRGSSTRWGARWLPSRGSG